MLKKITKNNFFIYSIGYLIILLVSKFILNLINIEYMSWFYFFSYNFIYITAIIGIVQFTLKTKTKKWEIILLSLSLIIITYITIWIQLLFYKPTHVIVKNDKKMEVTVHYWDRLFSIYYYDYINLFMKSRENIEYESFSRDPDLYKLENGTYSYDPFECNKEYKKYEEKSLIHEFFNNGMEFLENIVI